MKMNTITYEGANHSPQWGENIYCYKVIKYHLIMQLFVEMTLMMN